MAACNLYRAARNAQRACECARQFFVGRAVNGRCGHAHAKRSVMHARDSATTGARDDAHGEDNRALVFRTMNPLLSQFPIELSAYQRACHKLL